MNHSDIEHMAQGLPPSSIGKDHEEVVIFLATSLLAAQQRLDALAAEVDNCRGFVADHLGPEAELQFSGLDTHVADAILNSVRAEGVEMLAAHHQRIVDTLNGDSLFADGERSHAAIAAAAIYFAAQLRSQEAK